MKNRLYQALIKILPKDIIINSYQKDIFGLETILSVNKKWNSEDLEVLGLKNQGKHNILSHYMKDNTSFYFNEVLKNGSKVYELYSSVNREKIIKQKVYIPKID
jgi:hypothetical protein